MEDILIRPTIFGNYRFQIVSDDTPHNPRTEWDNLGTMICFHGRYRLGDNEESKQYSGHTEFLESLAEVDPDNDSQRRYFEQQQAKGTSYEQQLLTRIRRNHVILPLYLYDHSGITMSTGRFSCPWDSGQVGWIYLSHEQIRKEYSWKKLTTARIKTIEGYLTSEVGTYDDYLTGNVYGYKFFAPPDMAALKADGLTEDDITEKNIEEYCEELDSCWGFYGDNKSSGILEHADAVYYVKRRINAHLHQLKIWITNKVPTIHRTPLLETV